MDELPNKSYKPKEVAEKLGCTVDNVYELIKYGKLEAFKVGGRRHYRVTDHAIEDYLERMKIRAEEMKNG